MLGSSYESPTPCERKDEALAERAITLVVGAPRWVFYNQSYNPCCKSQNGALIIRAPTFFVEAKTVLLQKGRALHTKTTKMGLL